MPKGNQGQMKSAAMPSVNEIAVLKSQRILLHWLLKKSFYISSHVQPYAKLIVVANHGEKIGDCQLSL